MVSLSKLIFGAGKGQLQSNLTKYFIEAPWFSRMVYTYQTTGVADARAKLKKAAQIAKEEISSDFGGKRPGGK